MKALFGLSCLIDFYAPKSKPLSQKQIEGLTSHLWRIFSAAAELMPEETAAQLCEPTIRKFQQYCEMNRRPFRAASFPGSMEAREILGL